MNGSAGTGSESLHETRQADYFSEERSYVAAATYARLQTSADLRRELEPLAEAARRLASDLDGQERRQAEELRKTLEKLVRRAN
jgi:DNA helicase IV